MPAARNIARDAVAEFAGMTVFIIIGLGSVQGAGAADEPGLFVISTGFGAGLAAGLFVSGGHLNPVVTLMFLATGRMDLTRSVALIMSQMAGSIMASALVYSTVPGKLLGATVPGVGYGVGQAFVMEMMATAILLAVVWTVVTRDRSKNAPYIIGGTVLALHLITVSTSGASMNPARSFGPAVVANVWVHHWIYFVAPILGGILGCSSVELARIVSDSLDE